LSGYLSEKREKLSTVTVGCAVSQHCNQRQSV